MDATTAAAPAGFVGWIMANGQMVLFFAQIVFWLVLSVSALWAAVVFNKYVTFVVRGADSVQKSAPETDVAVDEFVE